MSGRFAEVEISLGTVAVLSNPLRYAFDEAAKAATQFAVGDTGKPPVAEDDEPGIEGATTSRRCGRRSPAACTP